MAKRTRSPLDPGDGPRAVLPRRRRVRGPVAPREPDPLTDDVLAREQAARTEAQRSAAETVEWRKRYEEAMEAASQLLHERTALMPLASIVESSADAIFSRTLDGIILNWN